MALRRIINADETSDFNIDYLRQKYTQGNIQDFVDNIFSLCVYFCMRMCR